MIPTSPLRLAVLLSGGGRTLQNIADTMARGELNARIVTVIASSPDCLGVTRARNLNLPVHAVVRQAYPNSASFSAAIWDIVRAAQADLVCLAGFLSLLSIPDDFAQRVINIHPALLPSFGGQGLFGHHVHEAVLAAGCKVSGCTVHYCDQTYDTGPIIVQRCCPVRDDDTPKTLAARVFAEECLAYPQAIRLIAAQQVAIEGRRTRIQN